MQKLKSCPKMVEKITAISKYTSKHKAVPSFLLSISFVAFIKDNLPFFSKNESSKIAKYWEPQPVTDVISQADKHFKMHAYMAAYELLNRMKYSKDIEIIWRISKALFYLSQNDGIDKKIKKEMIIEAHDILKSSADIGEGTGDFHKWMGIVLNEKYGLEGIKSRIAHYPEIKQHLAKACELNPKDYTRQNHTLKQLLVYQPIVADLKNVVYPVPNICWKNWKGITWEDPFCMMKDILDLTSKT